MTSLLKFKAMYGLTLCILCFGFVSAHAQQDPIRTGEQPTPSGTLSDPANSKSNVRGDTMPPRNIGNPQTEPRGTTEPQRQPRTGTLNDTIPPRGTGTNPRTDARTGTKSDSLPPRGTGGTNPRTDARTGTKSDSLRSSAAAHLANMSDWPESSKTAAQAMIQKYGQPQESTPSMLIWRDNGPWHKTVVTRHETQHDFPKTHKDVLQQTIYYKVPVDFYDDLARFDGSVTVDRTNGTLSARCDKEEHNILAINVANDIIKGKRTSNDARNFFAQAAAAFARGEKSEYTSGLMFRPDAKGGDMDKPATSTGTKAGTKAKAQKSSMKKSSN